jgi:hypothetical protein
VNAPQGLGIATNLSMNRYAANNTRRSRSSATRSSAARAEARWFTGDKANAIADLNLVRRPRWSGDRRRAATVASTDAQFIDALLYERRFSLFSEGHRWFDHIRLGRLDRCRWTWSTTPRLWRQRALRRACDAGAAGECLVRARSNDPALAGPGC